MTKEEIIRNLKYTMEKHKNDTVNTFGTNISVMCKDILDYLEQEPCDDAISRQAVLKLPRRTMHNYFGEVVGDVVWIDDIESLPSVQPIRPKGHWIDREEYDVDRWKCSECGITEQYPEDFCPNCGADMKG